MKSTRLPIKVKGYVDFVLNELKRRKQTPLTVWTKTFLRSIGLSESCIKNWDHSAPNLETMLLILDGLGFEMVIREKRT